MHKRTYLLFLHDSLSLLFKHSKLQASSFLWGVVRFGSNTLSSFLSLIRLYQPISVGSVFHSVSWHSLVFFKFPSQSFKAWELDSMKTNNYQWTKGKNMWLWQFFPSTIKAEIETFLKLPSHSSKTFSRNISTPIFVCFCTPIWKMIWNNLLILLFWLYILWRHFSCVISFFSKQISISISSRILFTSHLNCKDTLSSSENNCISFLIVPSLLIVYSSMVLSHIDGL